MAIFESNLMRIFTISALLFTATAIAPSPAPTLSPSTGMSPPASIPPSIGMSPAAAPSPDCMTLIYNMSDCLTYVEKGSKTKKPDANCCPELAGLLDSKPECLCNLVANSSDLPVQLDFNRALKLPSVCGLQTPPISACSAMSPSTGMPPSIPPSIGMSPAAAPSPDCMTLIYNMTDCLTYVEKGSKTEKPDPNCCPELAGLLDSKPVCLCNLLANSSDLPVQLDFNKALKLPSVCGLQTPPVSLCSAIGIPVAAPTSISAGARAPSTGMAMSPGMNMSPGPSAEETGGKNGVSTSYSHINRCLFFSVVIVAFLL